MNRTRYMIVRILQGILTLALIATINFILVRAAPGDPVSVIAGEAGASDPQFVAQLTSNDPEIAFQNLQTQQRHLPSSIRSSSLFAAF